MGYALQGEAPQEPAAIDLSKLCEPRRWQTMGSILHGNWPTFLWAMASTMSKEAMPIWRIASFGHLQSWQFSSLAKKEIQWLGQESSHCQHCRATANAKDQRCHKTKKNHHAGPEWVATSYSDHCQRLQCVGKWKKVSSFLTSGVSISYHSIFSMCIALKAPILAPSAFGMGRFHFSTQCFWLSTHCFSYMQALHASWACCFWIFASNLLLCTNLSSSEMQSHHGQWADWMAFAWKSKADFPCCTYKQIQWICYMWLPG